MRSYILGNVFGFSLMELDEKLFFDHKNIFVHGMGILQLIDDKKNHKIELTNYDVPWCGHV